MLFLFYAGAAGCACVAVPLAPKQDKQSKRKRMVWRSPVPTLRSLLPWTRSYALLASHAKDDLNMS